jgi:hypothetical protein
MLDGEGKIFVEITKSLQGFGCLLIQFGSILILSKVNVIV